MFKNIGTTMIVLGVAIGLFFVGLYGNRYVQGFQEQTRYETQQESQSYRDGLRRNLGQLQIQFLSADNTGRVAIGAVVKQQYGQLDRSHIDQMPQNLQDFLRSVGIY